MGPQGPIKRRRPRKTAPPPVISYDARNSLQSLLTTIDSFSPEALRDPNILARLKISFSSLQKAPEPEPEPEPAPVLVPGSYQADSVSDHFNKRWDNLADFHAWRALEEKKNGIEILRTTKANDGFVYATRQYYVCSRHGTGGLKKYVKKHSWNRKIEAKRNGCPCSLMIKTYLDTDVVLGHYKEHHNHELGNKNLRFTRISRQTRELIAGMLRAGISPENIVSCPLHLVSMTQLQYVYSSNRYMGQLRMTVLMNLTATTTLFFPEISSFVSVTLFASEKKSTPKESTLIEMTDSLSVNGLRDSLKIRPF